MSYIVGLTGQTGSGKTTASQMLVDAGFGVINCDEVARQVTHKGSECLGKISMNFGNEILTADLELDRKRLGEIVFADKGKLKELNDIIFPYITNAILEQINILSARYKIIVLDAPTLFESNANKLCNAIVAIVADEEISVDRIIKRDNLSTQTAKNRIHSQLKKEFFNNNCKYVVENNTTIQLFKQKLTEVIKLIEENANENY